jgi:hypothetical protein
MRASGKYRNVFEASEGGGEQNVVEIWTETKVRDLFIASDVSVGEMGCERKGRQESGGEGKGSCGKWMDIQYADLSFNRSSESGKGLV